MVEKYLWQGMTRLLAVYDGSDNLVMRFEYADERMPVAMTKGDETYYLIYDPIGSLRMVADSLGTVVRKIDYDTYGTVIADTNPTFDVPFGFAGGLCDIHTGLVRFGYRDYDPETGRWTAKDPILFAGGDTDLYGYVLKDPVNLMDPDGRNPIGIIIGAIAGSIGGAANAAINGNYISAVIGGVSGAIVGGLVGTVNPYGSSAAGAIAASWTAGVIGGFSGGAFSGFYNWATDPCSSEPNVLDSANEGAIGSAMVGAFTAPFGVIAQAAAGNTVVATAAVESANSTVSIGLGAVTSNIIPKGGVFVGR